MPVTKEQIEAYLDSDILERDLHPDDERAQDSGSKDMQTTVAINIVAERAKHLMAQLNEESDEADWLDGILRELGRIPMDKSFSELRKFPSLLINFAQLQVDIISRVENWLAFYVSDREGLETKEQGDAEISRLRLFRAVSFLVKAIEGDCEFDKMDSSKKLWGFPILSAKNKHEIKPHIDRIIGLYCPSNSDLDFRCNLHDINGLSQCYETNTAETRNAAIALINSMKGLFYALPDVDEQKQEETVDPLESPVALLGQYLLTTEKGERPEPGIWLAVIADLTRPSDKKMLQAIQTHVFR